jgi:hypothetical protein
MSVRSSVRVGLLLAAGAALVLSVAHAGGAADVKVGDWVSYKQTGGVFGTSTLKLTVTARDDKAATVRRELKVGNAQQPAKEERVPLGEFGDPRFLIRGLQAAVFKAESKKVAEGKETVTLGGKSYPCKWLTFKSAIEFGGKKFETDSKVWVSPDVPLGGMVKMVSETQGIKTEFELTGSGRGK